MGMVEDFGKVILLDKQIVESGSMSDQVTEYTFKNTFALYEDIVAEVQRLEGAISVRKGFEKWLECTHEVRADEDNIIVRFVFPYCD